jgi:hypothetical protein
MDDASKEKSSTEEKSSSKEEVSTAEKYRYGCMDVLSLF